MIQFRYDLPAIKRLIEQFEIEWITLDYRDRDLYRDEREWHLNCTRVIDALSVWCKTHGIANYATGFTQIELCITFGVKSEAMLFKLRWHDAQTA